MEQCGPPGHEGVASPEGVKETECVHVASTCACRSRSPGTPRRRRCNRAWPREADGGVTWRYAVRLGVCRPLPAGCI